MFMEAIPLQGIKSTNICTAFIVAWINRFAVRECIDSGNSVLCTSKLSKVCQKLGIEKRYFKLTRSELLNRKLGDGWAN